jgi:hypothetical protein
MARRKSRVAERYPALNDLRMRFVLNVVSIRVTRVKLIGVICCLFFSSGCQFNRANNLPRGAALLGYTNCIVDERPTAEDIAPARTGNYKWFSGQWYTKHPPALDHYSTNKGALVIGLGGDIVSAPQDFSPSGLPRLPGASGFYVEFEASLSGNDPDHWPALWLMPIEHNKAKDDRYDGDPVDFERWVEFDVDEGGFGPGHAGAVHVWSGIYPRYQKITGRTLSKESLDRTKRHAFGLSFDPRSGEVSWWVNNHKEKTVILTDPGKTAAKQNFYFLVSAQSHGKRVPYSLTLHRVRGFLPTTK